MAPKRKEIASSPAKQAKKVKHDPIAEKLKKQLREVTAALSNADITKELEKMLEIVVPLSLGEFSDQRHRFQAQVVNGIEGVLGEVEAALRQEVTDKRSERDLAAADKPQRDNAAADAASKLEAKIAEVHRLKVALAEKAVAFRDARSSLAQAEEAKVIDGQKAREAEKKKGDFLAAVEHLRILKTTSSEEGEARKTNAALMALLKKYKFEESMMIALPAALAKAPDARGQFDVMAITQLDGEIDKLIAEQDGILAAAAPGQAKCEAAIKAAEQRLTSAKGEQRTAAQAFDAASREQADCETASTAAQKAVRDNANQIKKLERALNNAEVEVELFEQGPKETFKVLRERTTPPPEVVAEEEEEGAPMVDEATEMKESEMPALPVVVA